MALKHLQFIVTVAVDAPDDEWVCPDTGTGRISNQIHSALDGDDYLEDHVGAPVISIVTEFETITD